MYNINFSVCHIKTIIVISSLLIILYIYTVYVIKTKINIQVMLKTKNY